MTQTLADALTKLVGETLSSVTFVADYLQLSFNGPGLTAYTPPTVGSGSASLKRGQPGYRDALCQQISCRVERTEVGTEEVSIFFENGARVSISLRDADYTAPEALVFSLDDKGPIWVV